MAGSFLGSASLATLTRSKHLSDDRPGTTIANLGVDTAPTPLPASGRGTFEKSVKQASQGALQKAPSFPPLWNGSGQEPAARLERSC